MLKIFLSTAVLLLAALAGPVLAASDLQLSRVLLSTGGVGYFEYEAEVEGNATLELEVRLDQVDDVLKSIVVFDDQGGVGTIELPGRQPLTEAFRELPFSRKALNSPVDLLNALQGAEVEVGGVRPLRGRVIRVIPETSALEGGGTITRHRVSLLTASGIRQFLLEDVDAVNFRDSRLRGQVEKALGQVALHGARDRRRLSIQARGTGKRRLRVAYIVEAPLWKASYRLTLDADPTGTEGLLQGWAVIENLSGQDWKGVELTLASGNPVTFRQALYKAYFVNRPEVPVEVLGRVLPRVDSGVVQPVARTPRPVPPGRSKRRAKASGGGVAGVMNMMSSPAAEAAMAPAAAQGAVAVASAEATTQVVFTIGDAIDVASGNSLAIPIIDRKVKAARLALFTPGGGSGSSPLATVRLANEGESGLPPGVLTLYERSSGGPVDYVGDARMGPLPAGENRLLSFAVDNKTKVAVEGGGESRVTKGRIVDGVFHFTRIRRETVTYRIKAPAREARTLLLEMPIKSGWRLISPKESEVERTASHYRLTRSLKAGENATIDLVAERPVQEQLRLVNLDSRRIAAFVDSRELSKEIRDAFTRMAALKGTIDKAKREVKRLQGKLASIDKDQQRLRDNLARVPRGGALANRYLRKLDAQEDAIEARERELDTARQALTAAQRELSTYVGALKL